MRRAKKIGIVCVGILMVVFMFLSYSNLFGGETKRDITKISVIGIKRKNSQVEDFKRGIEEAANAKRVDVEYLELEEDYDTIKEYIDREIKNGSQALIVFSEKEEQILSYLQSEKKKIPLILVNPGGTEEKTIRVWFDVQDMAECLAEKIHQKRQEEETVVYLTDEKEMSERMWTIFQETFQNQGIAIEKKKMTLPNLAKYRDQKQQAVFICSSPKITEETADYLKSKNQVIYGIGYSDEVLQGIREGKVEGVMAYSMYSFGIYAVKSAVYSIEGKKVDHLTKTKCEWITQDNIKEKYDFLFPIY